MHQSQFKQVPDEIISGSVYSTSLPCKNPLYRLIWEQWFSTFFHLYTFPSETDYIRKHCFKNTVPNPFPVEIWPQNRSFQHSLFFGELEENLIFDRKYTKRSNLNIYALKIHSSIFYSITMMALVYFVLPKLLQDFICAFKPELDKISKITFTSRENSDQPRHPPSLISVFAVRLKKALGSQLPIKRSAKTLISLVSLGGLGAHVILLVCRASAHLFLFY